MAGFGAMLANMGMDFGKLYAEKREGEKARHEQMDYDQMMWQKNYDMQKEFARWGIRWKMEDAIAAGLHPMAVLGMTGSSASPISSSGIQPVDTSYIGRGMDSMGQNIKGAIDSMMTKEETEGERVKIELMKSQIREGDARAGYYDSLSAREKTTGRMPGVVSEDQQYSSGLPGQNTPSLNLDGSLQGMVQVQPSQSPSSSKVDRSVSAGSKPLFDEYYIGSTNVPIRLPRSSEPGESLSEMSWYDKLLLIVHNSQYYGEGWTKAAVKAMMSVGPKDKQWMRRKDNPDRRRSGGQSGDW